MRVFTNRLLPNQKTRVKYYYDQKNPLLPVLIERRRADDPPSTLKLREVEWRS